MKRKENYLEYLADKALERLAMARKNADFLNPASATKRKVR